MLLVLFSLDLILKVIVHRNIVLLACGSPGTLVWTVSPLSQIWLLVDVLSQVWLLVEVTGVEVVGRGGLITVQFWTVAQVGPE